MSNYMRRSSLFVSLKNPNIDEEKVIEEALTTPYEKVIKILNNVKLHLHESNAQNTLIKDLDWVVERISSRKLYTYEITDQKKEFEQFSNNSHEVKSFFEYLNNYSENKEQRGRNVNPKCKTEHINKSDITEIKDKLHGKVKVDTFTPTSFFRKNSNQNDEIVRKTNKKKALTVNIQKPIGISLRKESTKEIKEEISFLSDDLSEANSDKSNQNVLEFEDDKHFSSDAEDDFDREIDKFIFEPKYIINFDHQKALGDIFTLSFNIFDLESRIGRDNVLPEGAKAIFNNFNLFKLISVKYLDNFLKQIRDGYLHETPYHNDMHGFDVCQTLSQYIYQTDIADYLSLDDVDILSIVIATLMHDIGHPGYNNTFQINSQSDIAITYNDKSVLENYHVSLGFKILKRPECNILDKMNLNEYKHLRKRVIESILSTDMIFHAKIHSLVKNKLAINEIKYGANIEKIVDKNSVDLFEDQQSVLNFLIHTADVSHNSKEFKISSKWTDLLMEEFWKQGDKEKSMGYPVSFLCDRTTAEVPKSQIGFIKSIIIPTFETLVDMLPALNIFKDNVYNNIDQWSEIVQKRNEEDTELKAIGK